MRPLKTTSTCRDSWPVQWWLCVAKRIAQTSLLGRCSSRLAAEAHLEPVDQAVDHWHYHQGEQR